MANPSKLEIVKKLESLIVLQKECLNAGNWDDYDKIEGEIKHLEEEIVSK
ncbi:MAG TPA: hypothetical protein PLK35_03950 [Candidatus Moranbacteria bacterium]|nr:hypothetical protein [Candidatus Moranbacteria bacterium]